MTRVVHIVPANGHAVQQERERADEPGRLERWARAAGALLVKHVLPIGLIGGLVLGAAYPAPGEYMDATPAGVAFICFIFFVSGLTLQTDEVKNAITEWPGTLYGVVAVLFITPLFGHVVVGLPLSPSEFRVGLALFCVSPTTLTSGVILTKLADGNYSLSLLLTVITNMLSVLTMPFMLPWILSNLSGASVDLQPVSLLTKLALIILLPLLFGKGLRAFAAVRAFVAAHKQTLKVSSTLALCSIPWMKMSVSSGELGQVNGESLAIVIALGVALHVAFLIVNYSATRVLRLELAEQKSVVIMSSQKTLTVAITVLDLLPPSAGDQGIVLVAVIVAHFMQIAVDALIVSSVWAPVKAEATPIAATPSAQEHPIVPREQVPDPGRRLGQVVPV